jgi:hypothetical protein
VPCPHTANLAPEPQFDVTVHVVLDDFGNSGRTYRETAEGAADFNTVVDDLMAGQFNNPVRVIAFNISDGSRKEISRSPVQHVALLNFISAKRNYCAPGSLTKAPEKIMRPR